MILDLSRSPGNLAKSYLLLIEKVSERSVSELSILSSNVTGTRVARRQNLPFTTLIHSASRSVSLFTGLDLVILTGVDRFDSSPEYISKSESEGVSV